MKITVEFELSYMNRHGEKDKPTDKELKDWFLNQWGVVSLDGKEKRYWKDSLHNSYFRMADIIQVKEHE